MNLEVDMKFGLAFPYNEVSSAAAWANAAEQAGWDGVFMGDAIWCQDPMLTLAAAATATARLQLGTMITPAPIRRPWKIASEAIALDHLSDGRFILGVGTGAAWMGWYAFPDEKADPKTRAGMLDETLDILRLLFQGKPFDYAGEHYHLELTKLNEVFYPPKPVRKPSIPLWTPAIWPRKSSMQRALKCDGVIPEKRDAEGNPADLTPEDIAGIKAFADQNREPSTPFDIVITHKFDTLEGSFAQWQEAGATWLVEELYDASKEEVLAKIWQGPPVVA